MFFNFNSGQRYNIFLNYSCFLQKSFILFNHNSKKQCLSFVTYSAAPARCEPHWLLSFVTYSAVPARCEPHGLLSFVTYSAVPARCEPHGLLSFVTYSAVPARRLSFAQPSLILRSTFAQPSLSL